MCKCESIEPTHQLFVRVLLGALRLLLQQRMHDVKELPVLYVERFLRYNRLLPIRIHAYANIYTIHITCISQLKTSASKYATYTHLDGKHLAEGLQRLQRRLLLSLLAHFDAHDIAHRVLLLHGSSLAHDSRKCVSALVFLGRTHKVCYGQPGVR